MRLFVDDLLGDAGIKIGMRLELEDNVQDVHEKENDACATADLEGEFICFHLVRPGCVEGRLRVG